MNEPVDVSTKSPVEPTYLGDGVYASFDGYHIWLKTGDGHDQQIALEPSVYFSLRRYAQSIWGKDA
jgi:hypothetical protein